jgi:flavin-dependent dehydrogenase
MKCGKIAGEVASDAISKDDTSLNKLKLSEKRIWKEVYPNYNMLYRIHEYACSKTDESWESTIRKLEKMADSETGRELGKKVIRGDFSKGYLLKTLPRFAMSNLVKIIK